MRDDKEPKQCCVVVAGKRCERKAMYRVRRKGFCEQHKQHAVEVRRSLGQVREFPDRPPFTDLFSKTGEIG